MIRAYPLAAFGFLLTFCTNATAEEKEPDRAWQEGYDPIVEGPYVYTSMRVPSDTHLKLSAIEDIPEQDPFVPHDPKIKAARDRLLNKTFPIIPRASLPKCLPLGNDYRSLSKLVIDNGVALKGNEWILLATDHEGFSRVHFCTTLGNADIIQQIFLGGCRHAPHSVNQLATLVSVENQVFQDTAWTLDKLNQLSPVIHARYGVQGRSGEKSNTRFAEAKQQIAYYETEPTIGENYQLLDYRVAFSNKLMTPPTQVSLATAITMNIGHPFVLDCGLHGTPHRNYFLILQSRMANQDSHNRLHPLVSLKKIDGIYAMPTKITPPQKADTPFVTHAYRANIRFLQDLRQKVEHHGKADGDAPFGNNDPKKRKIPLPPVRLTNLKDTKHYSTKDVVYDITPHLKHLGIPLFRDEWVYYNLTKNQLIIHGVPKLHTGILRYARMLSPTPRMMKIQAHIVEVDREGLSMPNWSLKAVSAANPKTLAKYSIPVRSGEKGTCGTITSRTTVKDPETGQTKEIDDYEFETEPTLTEDSKSIEMRFSIFTPPLGDSKRAITVISALAIPDGKPAIIELGHPNSATRTHLLILTADVITPDGSFYRDRFQPVE
ncbi:hypothetical protein NT6N_33580 [Oceaniferula spumae]|uniref:Secreted protein n=1 Tax=Oceaniferula spumae TaxID=2979115 RepID=A0AAT9FQR1_9BACT